LLLPVPPLFPPEPPEAAPLWLMDDFDTLEQAVRAINKPTTTEDRTNFAAEQGQRLIFLLSWSQRSS